VSKVTWQKPHHPLVTRRGCKWIRPIVTPHLIHGTQGPLESATQTASRSVQPFLHSTSARPSHRRTDRQTDRQRYVWHLSRKAASMLRMQTQP